jgi:hypothetical protein
VDWYRIGMETNYYGLHFHAFGRFFHRGKIVPPGD